MKLGMDMEENQMTITPIQNGVDNIVLILFEIV